MSVLETITEMRAGRRPVSGLLHGCRLHAFGSEVQGEEAIADRFRTLPYVTADPITVDAPGHFALFAGVGAIIADVADGNVARLWRVGPGPAIPAEPGVSVAFDPDMSQARGDLCFCSGDHPALADGAVTRVEGIGREIARADAAYRARAYTVRAFGSVAEGAALFAVYRQGAAGSPGFVNVAARWSGDEVVVVRDDAGEAALAVTPWKPQISA